MWSAPRHKEVSPLSSTVLPTQDYVLAHSGIASEFPGFHSIAEEPHLCHPTPDLGFASLPKGTQNMESGIQALFWVYLGLWRCGQGHRWTFLGLVTSWRTVSEE